MSFEFEVNNIHNFKTNLFVINNAIDNIELEKKFAKSRYKFGINKAYGLQCIGHTHKYIQKLIDEFIEKFNYKRLSLINNYLFVDKNKQQYTHMDINNNDDNINETQFASVIYLNTDNNVPSGTNLYELVNDQLPFDHSKVTTASIKSELNKMIFYDGRSIHKVKCGYGNEIDNMRLVMTLFAKSKVDLDNNSNIGMKSKYNNNIQYKLAMIDNYYINIDDVYNFFYEKEFYVNKNKRDKKEEIKCNMNYLLNTGHANNNIENNIPLFEQLLSQKIESIFSFFVSVNNSLIFDKEDNVWYGILFINKVLPRNKLMLDCDCDSHDILHAKQNRLLLFNSKNEGKMIVFDNVFIEIIKIKIK
tara:strand:- start:4162 stop:5241 length:1080 start_codon:yes stop_codon:yes gene_type:complete